MSMSPVHKSLHGINQTAYTCRVGGQGSHFIFVLFVSCWKTANQMVRDNGKHLCIK